MESGWFGEEKRVLIESLNRCDSCLATPVVAQPRELLSLTKWYPVQRPYGARDVQVHGGT